MTLLIHFERVENKNCSGIFTSLHPPSIVTPTFRVFIAFTIMLIESKTKKNDNILFNAHKKALINYVVTNLCYIFLITLHYPTLSQLFL